MNLLQIDDIVNIFMCPICKSRYLNVIENDFKKKILCHQCEREFTCKNNIIDFLVLEYLNKNNLIEIKGNTVDLQSQKSILVMTSKFHWDQLLSCLQMRKIKIIKNILKNYNSNTILIDLGAGTGFELQLLLPLKPFKKVLASDISETALSLVPISVKSIHGNLGLFTCEFNNCPIQKNERILGLIFEALHHSSDAHKSLELLLKKNFKNLIIVEPLTNWLMKIFARWGLAEKVESSGTKPDWLNLKKVKNIAKKNKFRISIYTFWEIPYQIIHYKLRSNLYLRFIIMKILDFFSLLTRPFQFGNFCVILFEENESNSNS